VRNNASKAWRRVLLALCVGAFVVGAWWSLRERTKVDGAAASEASRSEASDDRVGTASVGKSEAAGAEQPEARVEPSASDSARSSTWAHVFLEGNVIGVDTASGRAVLIVRPWLPGEGAHGVATSQAKWGNVDATGHFRVDISTCFPRDAEELVRELHVQVSSEERMPYQRVVAVPLTRAELERGGELVIPVELAVPALCDVEVDVATADGVAAEISLASLADASVRPGVERQLAYLNEPQGESRFSFELPCEEASYFVAFAPGYRPATLRVEAGRRSARVELTRGRSIAVRVRGLDARTAASIYARPLPPRDERMVGSRQLAWIDGAFEEALLHARCENDGNAAFMGLAPAQAYLCELRVDGGVVPPIQLTLAAGADSLEFDLALASLSVTMPSKVASRDIELAIASPEGSERTCRLTLPLQGPYWIQAPRGARVRALGASGEILGEVLVGEGPRTELALGASSTR
jgi:hypothetical protein